MPDTTILPVAGSKSSRHVNRILALCIDDDPAISEGLSRNFRKEGINTLRAYHGMQGYWFACTSSPDVIILDLQMPHGNGQEVIESLKQNISTRQIPIIVLSGLRDPGLEEQIIELGADRFLSKPAHFDTIFHAVCELA